MKAIVYDNPANIPYRKNMTGIKCNPSCMEICTLSVAFLRWKVNWASGKQHEYLDNLLTMTGEKQHKYTMFVSEIGIFMILVSKIFHLVR